MPCFDHCACETVSANKSDGTKALPVVLERIRISYVGGLPRRRPGNEIQGVDMDANGVDDHDGDEDTLCLFKKLAWPVRIQMLSDDTTNIAQNNKSDSDSFVAS